MKNSSTYERRFKSFLTRLRKAYEPASGEEDLPSAPTQELIWSALLEDTAEGTARVAFSRLSGRFVDFNELRVSRPEEIGEVLPNTLSEARERAQRIIKALQAVFDRFDKLEMPELREAPKREARGFIASMPQMTPFVEGRVCLLSLGVHAIPVDRMLVELMVRYGVVHPDTDPRDTQGFLERVVPAKDAVEVALLLEAFRQEPGRVRPPARKPGPARRKAAKKAAPTAARRRTRGKPARKK